VPISIVQVIVVATLAVVVVVLGLAITVWKSVRRKAERFGYDSVGAYLRSVPRSDDEKRDAVDLALKGLVLCLLGVVFPPVLLIGLFPLFYGGRKLAYAWMGLGLLDDADLPKA